MERHYGLASKLGAWQVIVRQALLIAVLIHAPCIAHAEEATISLSDLESKVPAALQIQAAQAQVRASESLVTEQESKEGLQLDAGLSGGKHRDVVTSTINYSYSAFVPQAGISYPLLGARATMREATQEARTQRDMNAADLEASRLQLLWQLRKSYILYWQYLRQEEVTEEHVAELSRMAHAARSLVNKGLWTEADFLQFTSDLAAARGNLSQVSTAKRDSLNDIRVVIGLNVPAFTPVLPEFPGLCTATPDIYKSAEANSADIKKLRAQLEDLRFDQDQTTGRAVSSAIYLRAQYTDEYNPKRYGYAVIAGATVSMPLDFMEADRANSDKLNAMSMQNNALTVQARNTLLLKVTDTLQDYQQAQQQVDAADSAEYAAKEALRESRLRFENVPQPQFGEVVQKIIREYHASLDDIEAKGNVALRANDLLHLAPDSCSAKR